MLFRIKCWWLFHSSICDQCFHSIERADPNSGQAGSQSFEAFLVMTKLTNHKSTKRMRQWDICLVLMLQTLAIVYQPILIAELWSVPTSACPTWRLASCRHMTTQMPGFGSRGRDLEALVLKSGQLLGYSCSLRRITVFQAIIGEVYGHSLGKWYFPP